MVAKRSDSNGDFEEEKVNDSHERNIQRTDIEFELLFDRRDFTDLREFLRQELLQEPVAVEKLPHDRDTLRVFVSVLGLLHAPIEQVEPSRTANPSPRCEAG